MIKCSKIPAIFNWFPDICYPRCLPDYWQWTFKISSSYNEVVPFVKIKYSKYSRMSQVIFCGRQPLKIFTWRILKYFVSYDPSKRGEQPFLFSFSLLPTWPQIIGMWRKARIYFSFYSRRPCTVCNGLEYGYHYISMDMLNAGICVLNMRICGCLMMLIMMVMMLRLMVNCFVVWLTNERH